LQAAKTNHEREIAAKEEEVEEARRSLMKQIYDLEGQLEDERKGRSVAQISNKKVQSERAELEAQLESEGKGKDDAMRMWKKTQVRQLGSYRISFV